MTEIEAKALALVNDHALNRRDDLLHAKTSELHYALLDAVQAQATTEARHAAEMRELKERFGEAAAKVVSYLNSICAGPTGMALRSELAPFIIPAPDMVSEWLSECSDGRVSDHTMTMLRLFHHWLSEKETRKIGDAGE